MEWDQDIIIPQLQLTSDNFDNDEIGNHIINYIFYSFKNKIVFYNDLYEIWIYQVSSWCVENEICYYIEYIPRNFNFLKVLTYLLTFK